MSRAFVDESASENSEHLSPELRIPLPPGAKNYVTPAGAARLAAELEQLLALPQPRLPEAERRIQYLSRMRSLMEVVPAPAAPVARVVFGTAVTVRDVAGGERVYRIVGVDESDPAHGAVSWISPVARALTGRRPGEQVRVRLPSGEQVLTVLRIQP
ncbi:MAG TPA: GreA/GreB family elongation factor [bacterium]|nr:GreA/GreB family elongation factor [bacterium]